MTHAEFMFMDFCIQKMDAVYRQWAAEQREKREAQAKESRKIVQA